MDSWWQLGEWSGVAGAELALHQIQCAFCAERGNWKLAFHAEKRKPNGHKKLNFDVYECGSCAAYVQVFWSASELSFDDGLHEYPVLPHPLNAKPKPSENWPNHVSRFWAQAHQSANTEIWDAASVMCRSAMQAVLRDKGASGRTLRDEIEDVGKKGLLPPIVMEWAHELRLLGNESAHPELDQTAANSQDVTDAIKFLDLLLHYIYDLPAKIGKYRARRNPKP